MVPLHCLSGLWGASTACVEPRKLGREGRIQDARLSQRDEGDHGSSSTTATSRARKGSPRAKLPKA
ncbi:MAG: hypothetical protein AMXMBFR64_43550 [Myxococcales bacterium]